MRVTALQGRSGLQAARHARLQLHTLVRSHSRVWALAYARVTPCQALTLHCATAHHVTPCRALRGAANAPTDDELFWLELAGALDAEKAALETTGPEEKVVETKPKTFERQANKRTPFSPLSAKQLQNKKNVSNNVKENEASKPQKPKAAEVDPPSRGAEGPQQSDAKRDAHVYLVEGQKLLRQGEFVSALEKFTAAIVLNPDSETAYHKRACCYFRQKRYENAIIEFQLALKLATKLNNTDTLHRLHHDLGQAYLKLRDFDMALGSFASAHECLVGILDVTSEADKSYDRAAKELAQVELVHIYTYDVMIR